MPAIVSEHKNIGQVGKGGIVRDDPRKADLPGYHGKGCYSGQGRVVYIRPGHETFPIFKDQNMLRLVENAARFGRPTSR